MLTEYTYEAERATAFLTGIPINSTITQAEISLSNNNNKPTINPVMIQYIYDLNNSAIIAAQNIVDFKTFILNNMLTCNLFTTNYPLLIEHIRREAKFYIDILVKLQNRTTTDVVKDAIKQEVFWNQIMAEHSKFIRGLLDPTEEALFDLSNNFGKEFDKLTKEALELTEEISMLPNVTEKSKAATERLRF